MRFAIIGCGGISGAIATVASMNEKVEVAACCDVTLAGAQRFAENHDLPAAYEDFAKLLANETLDAVYLGTPHYLHHPMTLAALDRGLHVWCEKPVAMSVAEAEEMAARARAVGRKIGIDYQLRYDPGSITMANSARQGEIGDIYYARCHVPYHREPPYYAGWHAIKAQAGGGTLLTVGSHMLDLALWCCASAPKRAVGMLSQRRFKNIEVEDLAMGVVELESGAMIEICSSMVATPEKHPSVELYGSKGTLYYPPEGGEEESYLVNLSRSLEGFRAWVEEGEPYRIPIEEAIPALRAVEMVYRSAGK